jgi:hypothetical protein
MDAISFDFAKQNQKKWRPFKIFIGGASRQGSFETTSHSAGRMTFPGANRHQRSGCPGL